MSNRDKFLNMLVATGKDVVTKTEIKSICAEIGISGAGWFTKDVANRVGRGLYKVPNSNIEMTAQVVKMPSEKISHGNRITNVVTDLETENLVPNVYKNYVYVIKLQK